MQRRQGSKTMFEEKHDQRGDDNGSEFSLQTCKSELQKTKRHFAAKSARSRNQIFSKARRHVSAKDPNAQLTAPGRSCGCQPGSFWGAQNGVPICAKRRSVLLNPRFCLACPKRAFFVNETHVAGQHRTAESFAACARQRSKTQH